MRAEQEIHLAVDPAAFCHRNHLARLRQAAAWVDLASSYQVQVSIVPHSLPSVSACALYPSMQSRQCDQE